PAPGRSGSGSAARSRVPRQPPRRARHGLAAVDDEMMSGDRAQVVRHRGDGGGDVARFRETPEGGTAAQRFAVLGLLVRGGVQTVPGATTLIRIPSAPSSPTIARMTPNMPAFAAQ